MIPTGERKLRRGKPMMAAGSQNPVLKVCSAHLLLPSAAAVYCPSPLNWDTVILSHLLVWRLLITRKKIKLTKPLTILEFLIQMPLSFLLPSRFYESKRAQLVSCTFTYLLTCFGGGTGDRISPGPHYVDPSGFELTASQVLRLFTTIPIF